MKLIGHLNFTGIPPHLIIIFVIWGIICGQESMKDNTVTKMIEELDTRCIG